MSMRITENMKFDKAVSSLGNVQGQYNTVLEQMASQKRINRLSDDPLGMTMLLGYRKGQAAIDQYQKNIDHSNVWLSMTESKLSSAGDLLTNAKELAIGQATASASPETRRIAAGNVGQLKEEMLSLANSTYGDRYLFSGSRMGAAPFAASSQPAGIDAPLLAFANIFDGSAVASGAYTAGTNKTYVVKIIDGGSLADVTYKVSADGGKTWSDAKTDLDLGTTNLPDGISLTFTDSGAKHLTAGDIFSVHAYATGNYKGDSADLTAEVGQDATINYNVTGAEAFSGQSGGVDIFKTLDDLKAALLGNDPAGILAQVDKLTAAFEQINLSVAKVGNLMNRTEIAKNNLNNFSQQLTDLTSRTEDVDVAGLATSLSMKQLALQASYATISKIGNNTILDFIK